MKRKNKNKCFLMASMSKGIIYEKSKEKRRTASLCYMVEDKMKKMKNCYLQY